MEIRNEMSATELKAKHGAIKIVSNPKNNGSLFFSCGSIVGAVGKTAKANIETCSIDDLSYAEVKVEDASGKEVWMPVLMYQDPKNVRRTL